MPFKLSKLLLQAVLEDIGHGDQLDRAVLDGQGVGRGAGAAPAAADQGHLDGVVARRVDVRHGHARQGRSGGESAGVFDEFTTRGRGRIIFHEKNFLPDGRELSTIKASDKSLRKFPAG